MWEIIMKMLLCLFLAALIGFIVGWLLRKLFLGDVTGELEAKLGERDAEINRLNASLSKAKTTAQTENAADDAEIASLRQKVTAFGSIEADLKACRENSATLEADLKGWQAKNTSLEADLKSWQEKNTSLEAEISDLREKGGNGASTATVATLAGLTGAATTASVMSSGDGGENAKLKARLAELEEENSFLLTRVKRAEAGEIIKVVPPEQRDDLELINGVGPVLERMLYDMGIYHFRDVASWDDAKIEEISTKLPQFKDRIRREGWVESAKEEHFKKYGERL